MQNHQGNKVWFITGAARGIGLSLARQLLARGDKVAATSRTLDSLHKALGNDTANLLALQVDLVSEASVQAAIEQTVATFGRIDVVVNNAAFGLAGPLETLSDGELRDNFDINVFGVLNVVRAVMPRLRAQRAGHVFNVSSILGFDGGYAGWGAYSATKFAVSGLSEALAAEAAPHGVRVSVVYPGTSSPAGDPAKAARVLIQAADAQYAPLHLFLGRDAFDQARAKIQSVQQELARWREMSVSIGFVDERRADERRVDERRLAA